ncbi:MAG TPA: hypothetical protein VGR25_11075 [bacterium]|jgi:hypothetical protein|nr:hypothetical protein [bacterium]
MRQHLSGHAKARLVLSRTGGILIALGILFLATPLPTRANHVSVDELLKRIFTDPDPVPYEMTADFEGTLTISGKGGQKLGARAAGSFREWRATQGGPKRRSVNITTLDLPLLLRPFSSNLRKLIQERIEREEGTLEILSDYDMFQLSETPGGRIILAGIRQDIVTEVLRRYGRGAEVKDTGTRRAIAKWLYQPRQRESIDRPGGPYLVTVVTDEEGRLYSLIAQYDWGPVETKIEWGTAAGRTAWRAVKMDSSTELNRYGRVVATMVLRFSNHCFDCRR